MKSGLLILAGLLAGAGAQGALVNRWSFNGVAGPVAPGTVFTDAISSASAVVVGTGAVATAAAITLPGGGTGNAAPGSLPAYLDLPNGIASSKTNLTVEIWASVQSYRQFQRLLDWGRVNVAGDGLGAPGEITGLSTNAPGTTQASDGITLTLSRNTANNVSQQRFEGKLNGSNVVDGTGYYRLADTAVATVTNTDYHYVVTFEDGVGSFGAAGGRLSWFRNGTNAASVDCGFRLAQVEDVNNWLGRSLWSADQMANARISEVRVYDHAFTSSELAASFLAGPDPAPAVASGDAAVLHRGQKVRVPVLANDTGANSGNVAVVVSPQFGSATPDARGRILYAHTNGLPAGDSFVYGVGGFGTNTLAMATVTVTFASAFRLTPTNLNVPATAPPLAIQLNPAFGGTAFSAPLGLASPPGDTQRVFVCEKGGLLRVVTNLTGAGGAQTFLNLPALLAARGEAISVNSEQGLLGLDFHPGYATNRLFFVFYSVSVAGQVYERVSRFTALTNNPNAADTNSEVVLIQQLDEAGNHNGGDLHFGADGYLYVSFGDEGNQNDTFTNSQTIAKDFFSAIARLDVDKRPGSLPPNHHPSIVAPTNYAIPPDNPFVGATNFNGLAVTSTSVRTEFWAVGFRNPWRFSFDPPTGELWVGDVGQNTYEEVDVVTRGSNYGWAYREGLHAGPGNRTPYMPVGFTNMSVNPLWEYVHGVGTNQGASITGGRVYRGARFPSLTNRYIFADYVSGNIWALTRNGTNAPSVGRLAGEVGIVAFGADPSNGDLLLADHDGARILRLEVATPAGQFPATLDETGLFADLTDLAPAPGVMPYAVNLPFWSDYAIKRRWFTQAHPTNLITWSRDGQWGLPDHTVWVKHFDLDLDRTNPLTRVRIETRVLVRTTNGAYGVSYRWNTNGTDAALVEDAGADFTLNVVEDGVPRTQAWRIPGRGECLGCHTPQAGHALSFTTRQLNRTNSMGGFTGNQLDLLYAGGCLANAPDPVNLLPRHLRPDETAFSLEARVRSYLEVNCAYCHQAGGSAPTAWDGRVVLTLDQTGLVNGPANNNGGNPANKLVVPGDVLHSIVLNRMAVTNGFTRMPPLGSSELDRTNIALVTAWILDVLPGRQTYGDWRLAQFGDTNSPAGEPGFDADADGHPNYFEFLAGSLPLASNSVPVPGLQPDGTNVAVTLALPENRSAQAERSSNLEQWLLWNIPGNAGLPTTGGVYQLLGPQADPQEFFRWRVREN